MLLTLTVSLAAIMALFVLLWIVGTIRQDVSIVDLFWGAGFALVAWLASWLNSPPSTRMLWLACLTTIWGLRLSVYLTCRNFGQGEDRRYAAMRERRGTAFWWISFFTVFLLQGAIMWFVSLPLQAAAVMNLQIALNSWDALGVCLWVGGMLFESIGDWQLARFKANPANAGKVMDRGLWRYTRHPNYFGDFCVWWGLYLIAAAGGAGWTILSPLLMTLLLMKVSGVDVLESTIAKRRPDYAAYRSRTNAFFPGPTKR